MYVIKAEFLCCKIKDTGEAKVDRPMLHALHDANRYGWIPWLKDSIYGRWSGLVRIKGTVKWSIIWPAKFVHSSVCMTVALHSFVISSGSFVPSVRLVCTCSCQKTTQFNFRSVRCIMVFSLISFIAVSSLPFWLCTSLFVLGTGVNRQTF